MFVTINNENILNSKQEKLLGVTIDNEFSCLSHVRNICKQESKKLHVLSRSCKFSTQDKRRLIMKAFIDSQFSYWPLVWIFHGNRGINNTMNKIHERALRMVYNDDISSYDELLLKENTFTIHQRNLGKNMFKSKKVSTVFNGTETVTYRTQQTWDMVPDDIKNSKSQMDLKIK